MSDIIKDEILFAEVIYLTLLMAFQFVVFMITALMARSRTTMYWGLLLAAIFSGLCLIGIGVFINYLVLIGAGILVVLFVPISYFRQKKIIPKELNEEAEKPKTPLEIEPEYVDFKESNHEDFMPK